MAENTLAITKRCDRTSYTEADVATVSRAMRRHSCPENAATTKQIATEIGLRDDRKLRAILSDFDGDLILVGKCSRGIFLADEPGQAAALTAELAAKTRSLEERLARRAAYASRHEPAQLAMGLAS